MASVRRRAIALVAALIVLTASCHAGGAGGPATVDDEAITVGSFNFPESVLLGELYAQVLERAGFHVIRQFDLGPRELVLPALQRGLLEVVPEYAGSALSFVGGSPTADPELTHERLTEAMRARGLSVLDGAPAMDRNGFAVTLATAARFNLTSLGGLTPHAAEMVFAGPPECAERPLCLEGLETTYDLHFADVLSLDTGGPLTVSALNAGTADVGLLFTSDPILNGGQLVLLRDDRGLEPAENVTPIVRDEVLQRFGPGVGAALNTLSGQLSTGELRSLNGSLESGATPSDVARAWIDSNVPAAAG
jgi:osmoprotectant transport system substrate-binding protein